jgi:hypothetical protein
VIGSDANRIEVQSGGQKANQYLNETVVSDIAVIEAGYDVVLATSDGAEPRWDICEL